MQINVNVAGLRKDKTAVSRFIKRFPRKAEKTILQIGELVVSHAKQKKLSANRHSYINTAGQRAGGFVSGGVLAVKSGRLRQSIRSKPINKGATVQAVKIGTNVANKGFSYPRHWETHGRAWLKPSYTENEKKIHGLVSTTIRRSAKR